MLDRLKKLWIISALDSAHLEDLLKRASNDALEHKEIPIRGDGVKKNYSYKPEPARFIARIKENPIKKITEEQA